MKEDRKRRERRRRSRRRWGGCNWKNGRRREEDQRVGR